MQSIKNILAHYPLFLLTIPGTFLVHMANYYYLLLEWKLIAWEIILYILIPLVLYWLFGRNDRAREKSGVLLFFFMTIFYFFHVGHEWLKKTQATASMAAYSILLPLLAIFALLIIIYLFKSKPPFPRFYYFGNLLFILLLIGGIIEHGYLRLFTNASQHDLGDSQKKLTAQYIPCDTCMKPDIYFIILDAYTNSKTLASEFNYNNGWITQFLMEKDFHIREHATSSYYFTQVSLASTLNMNYLGRLNTDDLFQTKEFFQSHYTIYQNELCAILKKEGYEINNYSLFDIKDHPSQIDPFLKELNRRSVIGQTFFHKLNRDIGWHLNKYKWKKQLKNEVKKVETDIRRIQQTYDGVINVARAHKKAPQFTYAHFLLPHETYYFDSTGKRTDIEAVLKRGLKPDDYISQISYTNRFVIARIVDSIFAHAKKPFVIILQGDHGYRNYPPEKLKLEFEIFNAVYFPDKDYRLLQHSGSPVNIFRTVLNQFFNQRLPVLKDSLIYLKKKEMIYR